MLRHNQCPSERNHHQNAEQCAQYRHQQHAGDLEIKTENENGRHCHTHTERNRFTRRTGRLHDVVLKNCRIAPAGTCIQSEERNGDDRHWN